MSTVYHCFQIVVPHVIRNAEDFYQETLRGTDKESLVPALFARALHHGMDYIDRDTYTYLLSGMAGCWAVFLYQGRQDGTWMGECAALGFMKSAQRVVDMNQSRYLSAKNNEGLNFALNTMVLMVEAYVLYKFKGDRNPSLPLKPYLYYGAGVVLLTRLKERYADQTIMTNLTGITGGDESAALINTLVSKFLIGSFMAYAVGQYTGETVQISRKWEALSSVGVYLASKLIDRYKYGWNSSFL